MRSTTLAFGLLLQALVPAQSLMFEDAHRHVGLGFGLDLNSLIFTDIDHDGNVDMIYGLEGPYAIGIERGRGQVVFEPLAPGASWVPKMTDGILVEGDFNGDGNIDFVVRLAILPYFPSYGTTVMYGDGTGVFVQASQSQFPSSQFVRSGSGHLAVDDLDRDGDLDIISGAMYLNDGAGNFREVTATHLPDLTSMHDTALVTGDFTGDGFPEVFFNGRLYRNDGTGHFLLMQSNLPSGADLCSIAVKANSSNRMALVLGRNQRAGNLQEVALEYYLSQGSGPLQRLYLFPKQGYHVEDWVAADIDGDGDEDLVLALYGQNQILLNMGAGGYVDAKSGALPLQLDLTDTVSAHDLDADGDVDLAFSNSGGWFELLLNDGVGKFVSVGRERMCFDSRAFHATAAEGARLLDVDGDKDLDYLDSGALLLNDGSGHFLRDARSFLPAVSSYHVSHSGDYDGDGDQDLAVFSNSNGGLALLLNDGSGSFSERHSYTIPATSKVVSLTVGDVDGDGDVDLIYSGAQSGGWLWSMQGYRAMPATSLTIPPGSKVALVDMDRDGDLDLLSWGGGRSFVHHNNGKGVFVTSTSYSFEVVHHGDIDGDGFVDVISTQLHLNDGRGGFKPAVVVHPAYRPRYGSDLVDFDGDGDLDLFVLKGGRSGSSGHEHVVFDNLGGGLFALVHTDWFEWVDYGPPGSCPQLWGDVDRDGDADFVRVSKRSRNYSLPHQIVVREVFVNGLRHLESPYLPRIGQNLRYIVHADRGRAATGLMAMVLVSHRRRAYPFDLGSLGLLWLEPLAFTGPGVLPLSSPEGAATIDLPIPGRPSLIGVDVHAQAIIIDLRKNPAARLTNLVSRTISH